MFSLSMAFSLWQSNHRSKESGYIWNASSPSHLSPSLHNHRNCCCASTTSSILYFPAIMMFSGIRSSSPPDDNDEAQAWLYSGAGQLIASLDNDTIQELTPVPENPSYDRDGFDYLCSYTAHCPTAAHPSTISVPGAPRTYTAPTRSRLVFNASGNSSLHVDPSSIANPPPPQPPYNSFNPVLQALSLSKAPADLNSIKIVTDRDTLVHLLSSCADLAEPPTANHNGPMQPYRLDLIMVNSQTLFLVRRAADHDDLNFVGHEMVNYFKGPPSKELKRLQARRDHATARKAFAQHVTALPTGLSGVSRTGTGRPVQEYEADEHYRIVSYNFGRNFKIMVRSQVDARELSVNEAQPTTDSVDYVRTVTNRAWSAGVSPSNAATAIPRGSLIAQEKVLDIDVRAVSVFRWLRKKAHIPSWKSGHVDPRGEPPWSETLARSWFGRVPRVVKAKHHEGSVTFGPEVDMLKGENWQLWEFHHRRALRRVEKVLEWMREKVARIEVQGDSLVRKAVFVCESVKGQAVMRLYEVEEGFEMDSVDAEYVEKFWSDYSQDS